MVSSSRAADFRRSKLSENLDMRLEQMEEGEREDSDEMVDRELAKEEVMSKLAA